MAEIKTKTAALTFGFGIALIHLIWAIIVATGSARAIVDWKLRLHFVELPITVTAFDPLTAVLLIVYSFIAGAIAGAVFAWIWNWAERK